MTKKEELEQDLRKHIQMAQEAQLNATKLQGIAEYLNHQYTQLLVAEKAEAEKKEKKTDKKD